MMTAALAETKLYGFGTTAQLIYEARLGIIDERKYQSYIRGYENLSNKEKEKIKSTQRNAQPLFCYRSQETNEFSKLVPFCSFIDSYVANGFGTFKYNHCHLKNGKNFTPIHKTDLTSSQSLISITYGLLTFALGIDKSTVLRFFNELSEAGVLVKKFVTMHGKFFIENLKNTHTSNVYLYDAQAMRSFIKSKFGENVRLSKIPKPILTMTMIRLKDYNGTKQGKTIEFDVRKYHNDYDDIDSVKKLKSYSKDELVFSIFRQFAHLTPPSADTMHTQKSIKHICKNELHDFVEKNKTLSPNCFNSEIERTYILDKYFGKDNYGLIDLSTLEKRIYCAFDNHRRSECENKFSDKYKINKNFSVFTDSFNNYMLPILKTYVIGSACNVLRRSGADLMAFGDKIFYSKSSCGALIGSDEEKQKFCDYAIDNTIKDIYHTLWGYTLSTYNKMVDGDQLSLAEKLLIGSNESIFSLPVNIHKYKEKIHQIDDRFNSENMLLDWEIGRMLFPDRGVKNQTAKELLTIYQEEYKDNPDKLKIADRELKFYTKTRKAIKQRHKSRKENLKKWLAEVIEEDLCHFEFGNDGKQNSPYKHYGEYTYGEIRKAMGQNEEVKEETYPQNHKKEYEEEYSEPVDCSSDWESHVYDSTKRKPQKYNPSHFCRLSDIKIPGYDY